MHRPPFNRYIVKIIDGRSGGKVKMVSVGGISDDELGCDWHPNEKAQKRIANEIFEQVKHDIEKQ